MENQNQSLQRSSNSTNIQAFEPSKPVKDQLDNSEAIAAVLVAKWIELERIILKAPEIEGRTDSEEEIKMMAAMMKRYGTFTPKEIGDAMRKAAEARQRDYSMNGGYPKMYLYDIEHELQKMGMERLKSKPEPLTLAQNTGGNQFWGEPSEALAREWPRIVRQTRLVRQTIHQTMRDRFWYGGSAEQRECAVKMLRQMVQEMMDAGKWDLVQNQWEALAIWQAEFCREFPTYGGMVDGMKCPICPIQVGEIRQKLSRIAITQGEFPDIDDARYCAVFDAYWKFTGADSMVFDDLEV